MSYSHSQAKAKAKSLSYEPLDAASADTWDSHCRLLEQSPRLFSENAVVLEMLKISSESGGESFYTQASASLDVCC